jgi:hypothetical protein
MQAFYGRVARRRPRSFAISARNTAFCWCALRWRHQKKALAKTSITNEL